MNAEQLRELQTPLKHKYRQSPEDAVAVFSAKGTVCLESLECRVDSACGEGREIVSGLHPMAGGDGRHACSGDMLLQSLVACSGVTLAAVATAMGLKIESVDISATGTADFRGTLGVDRSVPVGLTSVELEFYIQTSEPDDSVERLIELTERYCVVLQTLKNGVAVTSRRG